MEVFENGKNKACDIRSIDFPLICRICLRRRALRLLEQEDYLMDLFVAITKIDVHSTANYPNNICNECINELEDIALFIDISKYNDSRLGKNVPKKENECVAKVEFGMPQEPVIKTEKSTEGYEGDICTEKTEICQICLAPSCLTPFEEKAHLMQLFQNITNIDLAATSNSNFSSRNRICNKCIDKLESISLFISLSLSNYMKIESTIGRNESPKRENCVEENEIGFSLSEGNYMEFDNISDRKEVKLVNYLIESVCSYESKDLYTVVDIKEEILHSPEAPVGENDREGLDSCSETKSVEKQECDPCKKEFSSENHPKIIYKCNICKKGFVWKSYLQKHMLAHTRGKPFECNSCKKSFMMKQHLKMHMLIHTGKKPFKCGSCEKGFNSKQNLTSHMLIHTGEKPFQCGRCEKSFNHKYSLKIHMLNHSGEKPFKCGSCEKSFNKKYNLKSHMPTHSDEQPFKCDSCEKRFNRKESLKRHMLTHSGEKPFKCGSCEKSFKRKQCLKKHMPIHTGKIKCGSCEKSFNNKYNLKSHMLTHSEEQPFKCGSCEKSFNQKESLTRHMLTHTGEKPFKCGSCEKSFNRKESLKRHMLTYTHMLTHTGEFESSNVTSAKKVSLKRIR